MPGDMPAARTSVTTSKAEGMTATIAEGVRPLPWHEAGRAPSGRFAVVVFTLVVGAGCTTFNNARTLEPGQHAAMVTMGGPLADIPNVGVIPLPNVTVEGRHGIVDHLDVNWGTHLLPAAFGALGGHVQPQLPAPRHVPQQALRAPKATAQVLQAGAIVHAVAVLGHGGIHTRQLCLRGAQRQQDGKGLAHHDRCRLGAPGQLHRA